MKQDMKPKWRPNWVDDMNKVVRLAEIAEEMSEDQVSLTSQEIEIEEEPAIVQEEVSASAEAPELDERSATERLRMVEALLFAASEPLDEASLATSLPEGTDVKALISELQQIYQGRGVTLSKVAGKWQFRTAPDLAFLLRRERPEQRRLSRAAIETLAIISYHQPVTRAEIEDIRGVALSKGTLDTLMEIGWIKIRGRRRTPGRPVTYGTTDIFLIHFGLESVGHLPGMDELKAAGFLEALPPGGFDVPSPSDELAPDEDPYTGEEEEPDLLTGGAELDQPDTVAMPPEASEDQTG